MYSIVSYINIFVYVLIFLLGILGNVYALRKVLVILTSDSNSQSIKRTINFVLILSIVDLIVICIVPVLIIDNYVEKWPLAKWICKTFWTIENANKIGSRLILMFKAIERLVAVTFPFHVDSFIQGTSYIFLVIALLIVMISVLPIFIYTTTIEDINDIESESTEYSLALDGSNYSNNKRCFIDLPEQFEVSYNFYLFSIGYIIPTIVILLSYSFVIKTTFSRRNQYRADYWITVTKLSILSTVLYLVCWTPYWMISFILIMKIDSLTDLQVSVLTFIFIYIAHPLVYLNSALNWIPYVYFNRGLNDRNRDLNTIMTRRNQTITAFLTETRCCDKNKPKIKLELTNPQLVLLKSTCQNVSLSDECNEDVFL